MPVDAGDQRSLGKEEEAERKQHLDAYYRKKLQYLEEKSRQLDQLRRSQEKQDLQYMAAVPKVGERSQKLAELYRLRQKLIEDDLFLRKVYDREQRRFEAAPDPHYVFEMKHAPHAPLPGFRLGGDSESPKPAKRSASAKKMAASLRSAFEKGPTHRADLQLIDRHNFYEREKQFLAKKASNGHLQKVIDAEKKLDRASPAQHADRRLRPTKSQARLRNPGDSEERSRGQMVVSRESPLKPGTSKRSMEKTRPYLDTSNSRARKSARPSEPQLDSRVSVAGKTRKTGAKPAAATLEVLPRQPASDTLLAEPKASPLRTPAGAKKQAPISPLASPANRDSSKKQGEFFVRREEEQGSDSPPIEKYRKESQFLSPEEIIRNNSQLMKKSRPKQPAPEQRSRR